MRPAVDATRPELRLANVSTNLRQTPALRRQFRSVLEGINNKIKVIKRMAYGYRDDDYFFLKIRAAFPGIP